MASMRWIGPILAAALFGGAAQAAEVTFTGVDSYVDAAFEYPRSQKNLRAVQDGLAKEFSRLAERYLAPGQTLSVEVTGIDLAGRLEPLFASGDVRLMQEVTWPRLQFSYAVKENDRTISSGEVDLRDLDYLDGFNAYPSGDRLRYERRMLADWFRKALVR